MISKIRHLFFSPNLVKSRIARTLVNVFRLPPKWLNYYALPEIEIGSTHPVLETAIYYRKGRELLCSLPAHEKRWEGLSDDCHRWGSSFKSSKFRTENDIYVCTHPDTTIYTQIDEWSNHYFLIVNQKQSVIPVRGTGFKSEFATEIGNSRVSTLLERANWICEYWMSNYFHWIVHHLFKVWLFQHLEVNCPILVPAFYKDKKFMRDSLELVGAKDIVYFEGPVQVRHLNVVVSDKFPAIELPIFREMLIEKTGMENCRTHRKVFIRRKPSERRVIENEPEVLNSLELAGFTGIYMEDYSFADQIKIAVESKIIVGLHGAGMVNCMFMQKGSCVLELMNPDFMNPELFQLCNILGIQYDYFCGEARGDIQPCFQNVLIDVNALIVAVERTTKTSFD